MSSMSKRIGRANYEITPRFSYKLRGLVVATHDSKSWLDTAHEAWGDTLNTADICVVWGEDAFNSYLNRFHFSHDDWTCFFQTQDSTAYRSFRTDQFSNNHMLPADPEVAKEIAEIEIGDQIEFDGYLVDYSINGRAARRTSITRNDIGNGACEIVYTTSLRRLGRSQARWILLRKGCFRLAIAAFAVAFFALFVGPFIESRIEISD
jgi:hypothetical protein